jgi:hypothetical protein
MYRFELVLPSPVDVVVVDRALDVVEATLVLDVQDGCSDGSHSSLPQEETPTAPRHAMRKSRRGGAALDMLGRGF